MSMPSLTDKTFRGEKQHTSDQAPGKPDALSPHLTNDDVIHEKENQTFRQGDTDQRVLKVSGRQVGQDQYHDHYQNIHGRNFKSMAPAGQI